jgi:hypothetical protein
MWCPLVHEMNHEICEWTPKCPRTRMLMLQQACSLLRVHAVAPHAGLSVSLSLSL